MILFRNYRRIILKTETSALLERFKTSGLKFKNICILRWKSMNIILNKYIYMYMKAKTKSRSFLENGLTISNTF
jgi:hypothetical protein